MSATGPERITSRSNPLLAKLRKLASEPAAYRRQGEVVLEGEHLCSAWLLRGSAPLHAVVSDAGWDRPEIRSLAGAAERIVRVDAALMRSLGQLESPPPLLFVVPAPAIESISAGEPTLVLDGVQDPGNAGTMLRSAAAFGCTQVVAMMGSAALWSAKVLRAGMGAHFGLRLVEGASPADLEALALPMLGTSSHAAETVDRTRLPWPCAWVFGSEGRGLSDEVQSLCSQLLRIPQPGGEESLNVASAAAVCLYESSRQRRRD